MLLSGTRIHSCTKKQQKYLGMSTMPLFCANLILLLFLPHLTLRLLLLLHNILDF